MTAAPANAVGPAEFWTTGASRAGRPRIRAGPSVGPGPGARPQSFLTGCGWQHPGFLYPQTAEPWDSKTREDIPTSYWQLHRHLQRCVQVLMWGERWGGPSWSLGTVPLLHGPRALSLMLALPPHQELP